MKIKIDITNKKLVRILGTARDLADALRTIRHEHSNYDAAWQAGDWNQVSKEFAIELHRRLVGVDPKNAETYKRMIIRWMKAEKRI